ncbi:MAG: class I SAM-dependent methyltransferase [Candidatus Latescibacteria bacterium]|jgi:ubiquinone/menaquinone biosynthesis C-methylase UbiE|nr:class I SAM-dependent methyltransferase [Candidatus Latescibacterota bacterium]
MSIRSYFMAKFYDATMRQCEQACLGSWRSELLQSAAGTVLEIGSGTGVNLPHYSDNVQRLILVEPDKHMRHRLTARAKEPGNEHVEIASFGAESIDIEDETIDCVVSTLVLCSVSDQAASLSEIHRLLKPGGTLLLIEHVFAQQNPSVARWQKLLSPLWRVMCCNCHLNRNTRQAVHQAGFDTVQVEDTQMQEAPSVIKYAIKGVAHKQERRDSPAGVQNPW